MKKLFIGSLALVLLGGGCLGGGQGSEPEAVTGQWHLNFELPEGWVMTDYYSDGEVIDLESNITAEDTDIYLQSTDKTILRGGAAEGPVADLTEDQLAGSDYLLIHALRLSTRRVIPSDGEDIGNGIMKVEICGEDEDCRIGGAATHEYYYQSATNPYQFQVYFGGSYTLEDAEEIIKTLEEVTQIEE